MHSMAVRNADRRRHLVILTCAFLAVAYLAVSKWDQDAIDEMTAAAAKSPERAARYVTHLKEQALMYAVENAGHREYFASTLHCRAPIRGERLVMQHAAPHDPGRGYRCLYILTSPAAKREVTLTWSRSPELEVIR